MTTLVVASSQHGSTREIAERIAQVLRVNKGVTTVVEDTKDAPKWLATVDAVVVALPVYGGSLDKAVKAFLDTHRAELADKSLFILASGAAPSINPRLQATIDSYGPRDTAYLRDVEKRLNGMLAEEAAEAGVDVVLHQQRMEELDLPRRYRTIFLAGPTFTLLPDDDAASAQGEVEGELGALGLDLVVAVVLDQAVTVGDATHVRGVADDVGGAAQ